MNHQGEELAMVLSCPGRAERGAEISKILAENVRDHLIGFLRRRGGELTGKSAGLLELVRSFVERDLVWDIGLAFPGPAILAALSSAEPDAVLTAAKIAGHFYGCRLFGCWRAELSRPRSIRFGRNVTPEVIGLEVDGEEIEYRTLLGTKRARLRPLGQVEIDDQRRIWVAGESDRDSLLLDDEKPFATNPLEERVQELQAAVELVRKYSPEYLPWFGDTVRVVASWKGDGELIMSGSLPGQQGMIYIGQPLMITRIAESLVHEAAHQHYQAGEMMTRFHELGAEDRMYWSPYVRKDRPIDRILLAYHAFANVTVFYQNILESNAPVDIRVRAKAGLEQHRQNLRTFGGYLDESKELTRAGRALYRTVRERIAS